MEHFRNNELQRPDAFNFALDVVDVWAAKSPPLEAMLWVSSDGLSHKSLSYRYFSRQSHRIALLLEQLGVQPGDTMLMVLPRLPAWWEVATAGLRSGIVIAPATTLLTAADIEYRCHKSKAKAFVGDATSVAKALQIHHRCPSLQVVIQVDGKTDPDKGVTGLGEALQAIEPGAVYTTSRLGWNSPAILYFTSGTSGLPKMVRHNQVSYPLAHLITGKYWLKLSPGDLCWNYTEQGWGKAAYSFFGAWNCGASLFIWDDRQAFNPTSLLDILHRFPITSLCAPPLAWRQLVKPRCQEYYHKHRSRALRGCTSAGEALDQAVISQWRDLTGLVIREGYGQTEAILMCGNYGDFPIKPGSMGKPLPGIPLHVIQPDGEETAADVEGELALLLSDGERAAKFFGIFDGYVDDSGKATRHERVSNNNGTVQRWYMTGDKARRDKDGYLWFVGRADDVINSSGYRIGPFEVESTLRRHPAVAECAVISSPDMARGEVVKAIIVLTREYSSAPADALVKELQAFCKTSSAPYKYPRKIDFVQAETLPRTVSGKIKRAQLRKQEWGDVKARIAHKL
ncbi:hypothetical protein ASPVEDRAFT_147559 [Aspergillus versicolor CBS 583.65]|uniref:medium-chain acyl-CoA ligase n=1 Tax=Aspergillus versicolor CBS 583.65 TaxID=1036611 RepID=A0A1L9PA34_ASPVE|nr:uncharacterized protein ASPVEDRAFT_147559 [Aspergillus versicolor CBS 583.65]OJI98314.1 hypothetical protein ASPVEDRAFT_147559 [Aspergillus versicolor CBS 583.65]